MEEMTYYVAEDGTQFEDELDCMYYEMDKMLKLSTLEFLDYDRKKIKKKDTRSLESSLDDDVYYIIVRNAYDFYVLRALGSLIGFPCVFKEIKGKGVWQYRGYNSQKECLEYYPEHMVKLNDKRYKIDTGKDEDVVKIEKWFNEQLKKK